MTCAFTASSGYQFSLFSVSFIPPISFNSPQRTMEIRVACNTNHLLTLHRRLSYIKNSIHDSVISMGRMQMREQTEKGAGACNLHSQFNNIMIECPKQFRTIHSTANKSVNSKAIMIICTCVSTAFVFNWSLLPLQIDRWLQVEH